MAKEPTPKSSGKDSSGKSKPQDRADAEQEMLMREVDEAVRNDDVGDFAQKYGWHIGGGIALLFAAYGGLLLWQGQSEGALEEESEALIQAVYDLDQGNVDEADGELALAAQSDGGAAAMASMLRAGLALEQDRVDDAVALFDEISANGELPAEIRDIATIRSVTAQFDDLEPQAVIDRVGALAVPDNAYYGSAGELVAHAYLNQEKTDEAGALLVDLSRNEDVPPSIRGRSRQLAGLLGFDAIDDVDATLAEITGEEIDEPQVELVE